MGLRGVLAALLSVALMLASASASACTVRCDIKRSAGAACHHSDDARHAMAMPGMAMEHASAAPQPPVLVLPAAACSSACMALPALVASHCEAAGLEHLQPAAQTQPLVYSAGGIPASVVALPALRSVSACTALPLLAPLRV